MRTFELLRGVQPCSQGRSPMPQFPRSWKGEMTITIPVFEATGYQRALVTRQSARSLVTRLADAVARSDTEIQLDFKGIEAVTPSFMDELLETIDESLKGASIGTKTRFVVVIKNPPTRLSTKFSAIGKGRGYDISLTGDDGWLMTRSN